MTEQNSVDTYYDHAVAKGWILPTAQARSRLMCERILDAANQVFAEQGFEDAKISDIARVAGCSVGIFYKRFKDKESLFYVLQYRHRKNGRRQLDRLGEFVDSSLTTREVLYRFVRTSTEYILKEAGFERALYEMSLKDRVVMEEQQLHNRYASDRLLEFLAAREEIGFIDEDRRQRGHFTIRIVFGMVVALIALGPGPFAADDPRVVENLKMFLWRFLEDEQEREGKQIRRSRKR